jgi:adenosylhomocysteine nucleosidase
VTLPVPTPAHRRPRRRYRITRRRLGWIGSTAALIGAVISVGGATFGSTGSASPTSQSSAAALAPVGVISAEGTEQAPILAAMHVKKTVSIDGYLFYVGTIGGRPVVDAFGGEIDESAELATYLLISHFHPRAMLFSGTAGAQAAPINVGDVVLSGFVVDKSNIHYQLGGYQTPYEGIEVHAGANADLEGSVVDGYDTPPPTPSNAKNFGYGPSTTDKHWVYVGAFAGSKKLVTVAETKPALGTTTVADATGESSAKGTVRNKIVVGVIGQAQVWTEPLPWIEAQDFLYQTDAEENEGSGFAFASASQGVPWLLIRGISDTPWHPNAYDGVIASAHAAEVAINEVEHLPAVVAKTPVAFSDLSPETNARTAGYLIASKAWFSVGPVTKVTYKSSTGKTATLSGAALSKLEQEYTYGASRIGAGG